MLSLRQILYETENSIIDAGSECIKDSRRHALQLLLNHVRYLDLPSLDCEAWRI